MTLSCHFFYSSLQPFDVGVCLHSYFIGKETEVTELGITEKGLEWVIFYPRVHYTIVWFSELRRNFVFYHLSVPILRSSQNKNPQSYILPVEQTNAFHSQWKPETHKMNFVIANPCLWAAAQTGKTHIMHTWLSLHIHNAVRLPWRCIIIVSQYLT